MHQLTPAYHLGVPVDVFGEREQAKTFVRTPRRKRGPFSLPPQTKARATYQAPAHVGGFWRLLICIPCGTLSKCEATCRLTSASGPSTSWVPSLWVIAESGASGYRQGDGLVTPSKASLTRACGVHTWGYPEALRVGSTHLSAAVGNLLPFHSISLHPVRLTLCLAP